MLATESVHINIKDLPSTNQTSSHVPKPTTFSSPAVIEVPTSNVTSFSTRTPNEQGLRTIELSSGRIREGFGKPQVIQLRLNAFFRSDFIFIFQQMEM